jgi:hypothetical protein
MRPVVASRSAGEPASGPSRIERAAAVISLESTWNLAKVDELTPSPRPLNDSAAMSFNVDRAFVFAIRDRLTGSLLFLGRVDDPSAE